MANLKYGSSGSEVEKLQNALIGAGYDVGKTGADGVYGKNTANAVKQYQKDNGLAVDGIAGKNTLGALYGNSTANGEQSNTTTTDTEAPATGGGFKYDDFTYEDHTPSDIVNEAHGLLQQQEATKPGDYTPVWQDEADSYLSQFQNRDPFSYDFNSDALYQQYKDMYVQQGQMAMMDTMGQAAAMTGGYGNSYAQTAGQQVYNQHLNQLNAIIPELYQMAHDRYTQEGQDLLQMYDIYMNRESQEYGKYQDNLSNWYKETARLQDNYNTLYDRDYNEYMDDKLLAREDYQTGRSEAYDEYQKNIDREYQKERDKIADEQWQKQYDLQKKASKGGSGSKTGTYKSLDVGSSAYNTITKEVEGANSIQSLEAITKKYLGLGYDPAQVNALTEYKAQQIMNATQVVSNTVDGVLGALKGIASYF